MAKAVKKKGKNRRLKRSIRKTLGAMFLASALAVAAIPTEGLQAADIDPVADPPTTTTVEPPHTDGVGGTDPMRVSIAPLGTKSVPDLWAKTIIPDVTDATYGFDNKIYTSEKMNLQFVVSNMHDDKAYAVIIGYNNQNQLDNIGNVLTIPETVDVYADLNGRSCAVGGNNGELLFYKTERTVNIVSGGDTIPVQKEVYLPCLASEIEEWKGKEYNPETKQGGLYYISGLTSYNANGVAAKDIYGKDITIVFDDHRMPYLKDASSPTGRTEIPVEGVWVRAQDSFTQRITGIKVRYIANQCMINEMVTTIKNADGTSNVKTVTEKDDGIFSGATVSSLVVQPNLQGIGNYAFAGTGIKTVELSESIREIGNYAFSGCHDLREFTINSIAENVVIGDHAFTNCVNLLGFDARKVRKIGDSAFEGCGALTSMHLLYKDRINPAEDPNTNTGNIENIGYYAFADCGSLTEIIFPSSYDEKIPISTIKGCGQLTHIYAAGKDPVMNFVNGTADEAYYSFEDFRREANAVLYFEGAQGCDLEKTVINNYFVFKYRDQEIYKKKVPDESSPVAGGGYLTATFEVTRVDGTNIGAISSVQIDRGLENLKIPGVIGPLSVTEIGEGGFEDNCDLKSVVIPATITSIGANAFKGCHNLKSVIFEDAAKIPRASIGENAFLTQVVGNGHTHTSNSVLASKPELYFTGTVEKGVGPFDYAMDKDVYINNSNSSVSQEPTHIVYYSGWPDNLTVENRDGVATLTNYPTIQQLMAPENEFSFTASNYPYMTLNPNYEPAAYAAFRKYLGMDDKEWSDLKDYYKNHSKESYRNYDLGNDPTVLTSPEIEIKDHTLNVILPEGVQAIEEELFLEKEAEGDYKYLRGHGDLPSDLGSVSGGDAATGSLTAVKTGNPLGKTFTVNLENITKESFADCMMLETVNIGAGTKTIGDYAFRDCSFLKAVNIGPNVETMGLVPFIRCNKLANVNLIYPSQNPNFSCEESVLFGRASDGTVTKIIEYLNGADDHTLSENVLDRTTEIGEEAFKDTSIEEADFSRASITEIPSRAFANTESLLMVTLPPTARDTIRDYAFENSGIRSLKGIPSDLVIESKAFEGVKPYCNLWAPKGSRAESFVKGSGQSNTKFKEGTEVVSYKIRFCYLDENHKLQVVYEVTKQEDTLIKVDDLWKTALAEGTATPLPDSIGGEVFKEWSGDSIFVLDDDIDIVAEYGGKDTHTITFWSDEHIQMGPSYDLTLGEALREEFIPNPTVSGKEFDRWYYMDPKGEIKAGTYSISDIKDVTGDMWFEARYKTGGNGTTSGNGSGGDGTGGNGTGGDGTGGNGTGTGGNGTGTGGNGTTSGNGSGTAAGTYYSLTVINGHGSGSYVAGQQAIISANDPASGMEFSNWTIDPSGTTIASTGVSATVVTMPAANVTVTAHFRAKTGSTTGSGNTSSANAGRRPNSTGTVSSGGTTVVIDKNGISNTGVVAATVNGSSDNFVIKITENSSASEAVVRALMAEYGSLDNIKYFPMDITLYDSTGTNKITDTTGLSVSITLPLPDSLITYAGNNRVAGVVNDRLDKLTPKFTTISGVSCITFTAEHFSPYVIYVDTANLSAGGSADSTPKTGDGIHPKWFLSIGLACLSFVMFMQKDKRKPQKVKVKAKA